MPAPLPPARTPLFSPVPPKRRTNRLAIWLALGVTLIFVPLTFHYQNNRARQVRAQKEVATPTVPRSIEETGDQSQPAEIRRWHMDGVDGITETQARSRFGKPIFSRDYNLNYGAFLGPEYGLKHYFLNSSPGFEDRRQAAAMVWTYPEYTTIREMIWKLRESYLTLWLHEPRIEVNIQGETADALYPHTAPGEWVVLDNYRVGQDLVKNPPVATATATP